MRRWLIALLGLAGCVSDGAGVEWARLEGPRFLGVQSGPTVAGVSDSVGLQALVVDGNGEAVETVAAPISWRVCNPWQPVDVAERDCGPEASMPLTMGYYRTDEVLSAFPPERGLPLFFDIPIIAETAVEGRRLVALKEVRTTREFWAPFRTNPVVAALLFDGRASDEPIEPGRTYRLQVLLDDAYIDRVDDGSGTISLEQVDVHVYVTAGEVSRSPIRFRGGTLTHDRVDGATFTAPMDPGAEIVFWLVAVDGDGGTGWRQLSAQVAAPP